MNDWLTQFYSSHGYVPCLPGAQWCLHAAWCLCHQGNKNLFCCDLILYSHNHYLAIYSIIIYIYCTADSDWRTYLWWVCWICPSCCWSHWIWGEDCRSYCFPWCKIISPIYNSLYHFRNKFFNIFFIKFSLIHFVRVMVSVAPALTQPPVWLPLMPPCPMSCQSLLVFFLKALLDIAVSFQALEPVVKPL